MSFLNPLMLLGLAAAAIPIVVHFFNLRRPRTVDFSSLAFVRQVEKSTMQRVKIKEWLLLALRVLAVAALALAFARPVLNAGVAGTVGAQAPTSMAVVVDNSLSMTVRDGQGQYLRQAQERAAGLLDQMQGADDVFVLPTAGDRQAGASAYKNKAPAREAVEALQARPGAASLAQTAARASRRLRQDAANPNRELYLISDLQKQTLADSLGASAAGSAGNNVRAALLPVGRRTPANVAVTGVEVKSRIVEVGQPAHVEATLKNFGTEEATGYAASLHLEGERLAQATADLGAGQSRTVAFTVTPRQRGWLAGTVEIEDDDFPADNTRHFVLHVPKTRRVLVVRGKSAEDRFVQLALSSDLSEGSPVFRAETIGEGALAGTAPGAYDAVVLVGPQTLASGERAALARYVKGGGGLLLFPGPKMQRGDYNALLKSLGGGRITGQAGTVGGQEPVASFAHVDTDHPLFEGVFNRTRGGRRVEQPEIYRVAQYAPQSGHEQTLIELSDGRPFLQEIRYGRGAVLFMAAAPSPAWSDLPTRGLFVPLLYRSLYYLSAGAVRAEGALTAGRGGDLRVTGVTEGAPLRFVGPSGEELKPEQKRLFGAVLLQVGPAARASGVYDVRQGETLVRRVAVNLDPRESDLRPASAEDAAERLGETLRADVRVLDVDAGRGAAPGAAVAEALRTERAGLEVWNLFLLLALLLLIAEMTVARLWKPEAAES